MLVAGVFSRSRGTALHGPCPRRASRCQAAAARRPGTRQTPADVDLGASSSDDDSETAASAAAAAATRAGSNFRAIERARRDREGAHYDVFSFFRIFSALVFFRLTHTSPSAARRQDEDKEDDDEETTEPSSLVDFRARIAKTRLRQAVDPKGAVQPGVSLPTARVPWRTRQTAAKPKYESALRAGWQIRLALAAKVGDYKDAGEKLRAMVDDGVLPGPREFHAVIAAHTLAGDIVGALAVAKDAHSQGERLLCETYRALLRCAVALHDVDLAVEVQEAIVQAEYDESEAWLLLCHSLFRVGLVADGYQCVEMGRDRGLEPDEEVALHMLRFCADKGLQPEASLLMDRYRYLGLALTQEHHNAYVEAMVYSFGKRGILQMQLLGHFWNTVGTAGTNMLLATMRDHPSQLADTGAAWNPSALLRTLESRLSDRGEEPEALTYCLACEVAMLVDVMDLALHFFRQLVRFPEARGGSGAALLSSNAAIMLVTKLSDGGDGLALAEVLAALAADGLQLPRNVCDTDLRGTTLASRWLRAQRATTLDVDIVRQRIERGQRMEAQAIAKANRLISRSEEQRSVLPILSKMKISELREEAEVLGLDPTGPRKAVYERVREARQVVKDGTASPEMFAAMARLTALAMSADEDEAEIGTPEDGPSSAGVDASVDGDLAKDALTGVLLPAALKLEVEDAPVTRQRVEEFFGLSAMPHDQATDVGIAILGLADAVGCPPSQADLVAVAREAKAAGAAAKALKILDMARGGENSTPTLALYILAAEAFAVAGDREGALQRLDEADWVGYIVPTDLVVAALSPEPGLLSASDIVRLPDDGERLDGAAAFMPAARGGEE